MRNISETLSVSDMWCIFIAAEASPLAVFLSSVLMLVFEFLTAVNMKNGEWSAICRAAPRHVARLTFLFRSVGRASDVTSLDEPRVV
jgi:hypothetical protein